MIRMLIFKKKLSKKSPAVFVYRRAFLFDNRCFNEQIRVLIRQKYIGYIKNRTNMVEYTICNRKTDR